MLELDGATLTFESFREQCLRPNVPAIIRNAVTSGGQCCFDIPHLKNVLSPTMLRSRLGPDHVVPVYGMPPTHTPDSSSLATSAEERVTEEHTEGGSDMGECVEATLEEVIQSWVDPAPHSLLPSRQERVLYLKDWHLQSDLESTASLPLASREAARERGSHGDGLYLLPPFLGEDWMDPFCAHMNSSRPSSDELPSFSTPTGFGNGLSDYRFAYMGPVGSWTPLHCDVFGTYSWSLNVVGEKLWYFPSRSGNAYLHAHLLPGYPAPPDVRVLTGFELFAVVQQPGDLVFVPALYFHQVHNIGGVAFPIQTEAEGGGSALTRPLTIALNHNWCNRFNVGCMVEAFIRDVALLARRLDRADMEAIHGPSPERWRAEVNGMLQRGANWSFSSLHTFLEFCLSRGGDDESHAALEELNGKVKACYEGLFQSS